MQSAPLVIAVLLGTGLLAGCATKAEPASPRAIEGLDVGSIGGQVLDDEFRPVAEASASLPEIGLSTITTDDGRFFLSGIPIGTHRLVVERAGYSPNERMVTVSADATITLSFRLFAIPSTNAFHETFAFGGLQQCMIYTIAYATHCTRPYTTVHGTAAQNGVNLTSLGLPPDLLEDRIRTNFSVRADHTGIVSELVWKKNSEASTFYWLSLSCPWYSPVYDACVAPGQTQPSDANVYAHKRGPSPLRAEWKHPRPEWLPWVMARAYLTGTIDQYASVALDQRIDMYNTVFYGGPVPDDWSVLVPTT